MNKKPVYYLQTDPRWSKEPYRVTGETSTVGSAGCGPSCAAMLIETLTGKTFTPLDACKWSIAHGYKALKQGTYYAYFTPQFEAYGLRCEMLNWTNTYGKPDHANHQKALELLKQGYYLIALMGKGQWTSSGHFVVVWWEDGKVRINDPASQKDARLNGDITTFRSQVKYYWWVDARAHNNGTDKKEEDEVPTYEKLTDVPESYRPTIKKLMEKGGLAGYKDPDPTTLEDNIIRVDETYCRVMTSLDRLGVLGD